MDKVVQSLSARGEDCVRLRHQIALEPCEPRPPDIVSPSVVRDLFLNPVAGDEASCGGSLPLLLTARSGIVLSAGWSSRSQRNSI